MRSARAVNWHRAGVKLPGNTLAARNWCSAAPGVSSPTRSLSELFRQVFF